MTSPPPKQDPSPPNWLELPADVSASILRRLGTLEILTRAQLVCSTWRNICRDPSMWRSIDLRTAFDPSITCCEVEKMCRNAVDRSSGGLLSINFEYFCSDNLLRYIADRSGCLRRLRLVHCGNFSNKAVSELVGKNRDLEEVEISYCSFSSEAVAEVGRHCPLLQSFKLNTRGCVRPPVVECDDEALAIARNMPGLRHLQIFGNMLTNDGLSAILEGCPQLESLDLRQCFNVNWDENLGRTYAERIKDLRLPYDSTDDYPFDTECYGLGSSDEDDLYLYAAIDFSSY